MDRSGYTPRDDFDELQYRRIVNAGIAAVKAGDLQQARQLLHKATEMKLTDPDPWLWLSATTDDPAEQRDYLEYALPWIGVALG
jgi:Tfp pilus assembly protein PilF